MVLVDGDTLQEVYGDEPWKVLVVCVLLNRTTRRQVDLVRDELFERWKTPEELSGADERELSALLHPLGFYNRRAASLKKLAAAWLTADVEKDGVESLPGVGKYAADSWAIFVEKRTDVEPEDKVLIKTLCELETRTTKNGYARTDEI